MRGRVWALVMGLAIGGASPAWAEAAWLARPDARLTLQVDEVSLPALLVFVARVGGSELAVEPGIGGTVQGVSFERVRAEDALQRLLKDGHLTLKQVGGRLVVTRGEPTRAPVPPIAPAPARPELIVP